MELQLEGRISAGSDLLDADLRDIEIVSAGNATFLYAATGQNGGISLYRLDDAGGLASLSDSGYFSGAGMAMGRFDVVGLDGAVRLVLGGTGNGTLISYGVQDNGVLGAPAQTDLPGTGVETGAALAGVTLAGGTTALYMVDGDTGALAAYVSDGAGAISATAGLAGKASAYALDAVVALETVKSGGVSYLLAADAASGGVRSFRIDTGTGGLTYTDSLGAENGLGVALPSAMEVVRAHGATWVVLAASGSGTLSVMKLAPNGQLTPADHILDTLATRFGGAAALEVIKVGPHVFVLAGGGDDGISLFSLLPDGQLVHMQSLAHTAGAGLENVTGIEAVQFGDGLQVFVTSGAAPGISQFSLSLGDLGLVIQGDDTGGGQVLGTGAGDLIVGRGGQDRLMGQGGDDILVASQDGGILSGGAGADIFVLYPTTGTLEISDFEPGTDRLDLTRFPMLRSLSQLTLATTSSGIDITYGATTIVIRSHDGKPLKATDIWPAGFDTPDRVPIPEGPVIRVTTGTEANDRLILGSGQDTVRALAGNDLIRGGADDDRLIGGDGGDRMFGGNDNDTLKGGKGRDMLKGGAGKDKIHGGAGNDTGYGEDGRDRMFGGGGNDTLSGGKGRDVLAGGKGDDILSGGAGGDTVSGGAGNDRLKGGAGRDTLKGGAGGDVLGGGDGQDILKGGAGRDILRGGEGADTLLGGRGNDKLTGGPGKDILTGGGGRDVFLFAAGHGNDRISDFTAGEDRIRLDTGPGGFGDLTLTRQGDDTLIDTGAGSITLGDVLPGDLSADDFLFS